MELATLKEKLKEELQEAKEEHLQLEEQLDEKPDFGPGTGSTGAYTWEMALARREQVSERISSLEAALSRLKEGNYGVCQNCGNPINPERLEILPETKFCTSCAAQKA